MSKKYLSKILIYLAVSVFLELFLFNFRALLSLNATNQFPEVVRDGNTFYVSEMKGMPNYLYVGINKSDEDGRLLEVTFTVLLQDEGHSNYYELSPVTMYSAIEKSRNYGG